MNQAELARPPIARYNIWDEDTVLFSDNRKHNNAIRNAAIVADKTGLPNPRKKVTSRVLRLKRCKVGSLLRETANRM